MNETELERLVVRLTGDGSEYARMLQQAQQETRETAQLVEEQGKRIEGFGEKLKGFATGALSYLGSLGIKQWLMDTLGAYKEQEKAEKQLAIILGVNGRNVEENMERYKEYATRMQELTGAADEVTLSMLKQAEAMGVTGANAERAVKNVIAAEAAGMHIGIRQAAMLEQGHLGRLARQLGDLGQGSEQQKIAVAQSRLSKMFAIAEEEGKKTAVQLRVAWNELYEEFGKAVKEVMKPVNEVKLAVVQWFRSLSDGSKQAIVVMASVAAAVLAIAAAIATAGFIFNTMFGGIGLIVGIIVTAGAASAYWLSTFESIGKAWEYVKEKGVAAWVYIKEKAVEFWDWILPAARAVWGVLTAGWEIVKEVASFTWEVIKDYAKIAYDFITSGWGEFFRGWDVNWDQALSKFVNIMIDVEFGLRNFMRIAVAMVDQARLAFHVWFEEIKHGFANLFSVNGVGDRVISDFERDLTRSVNRQLAGLGSDLETFRTQRLEEYFSVTPAQERQIEEAGRRQEAALNRGKTKEMEKFDAAARGSAEALSRIYAYNMRVFAPSASNDPVVRAQDTTNRILGRMETQLEIANQRPQIVVEDADLE